MSTGSFSESIVEDVSLAWHHVLGHAAPLGPDIAVVALVDERVVEGSM